MLLIVSATKTDAYIQINSFFGQSQFRERFGTYDPVAGKNVITPAWQSGLSNSALVGQLAGLVLTSFAQDRFGCRPTYLFFMAWMNFMIFIAVFAPSLSVLAFGEAMSGISWGVFQVRDQPHYRLDILTDKIRLSQRHTPAKLPLQCSVPSLRPMSLSAGVVAFSFLLASSVQLLGLRATLGGDCRSAFNGAGPYHFSLEFGSPLNLRGAP